MDGVLDWFELVVPITDHVVHGMDAAVKAFGISMCPHAHRLLPT